MNRNFLSNLGLAKKAGKLIVGYDRLKDFKKKVPAVFVSNDVSAKTSANAAMQSASGEVIVTEYTMEQLGRALGVKRAAVVAVLDENILNILL